ncbi:MAG: FRG domain-containing protein [Methylosarcina sp.]
MAIVNEPTWTILGKGYHQLQLPSWKHFLDYVYNEMLDFETYVWRGQRCDSWKLEPTIDRLIREAKVTLPERYKFQSQHLENFKLAVRGRRGSNPSQLTDENDWWALGQHHGLATPLLDWTTSPFVAAFFAFSEQGMQQTEHRAIFALHQPTVDSWSSTKQIAAYVENREKLRQLEQSGKKPGLLQYAMLTGETQPEVVFIRPLSDENHRLVSQGGLFTRTLADVPIEDWVEQNYPADDSGLTLLKILVPNRDRDVCLRTLNRMNINPLSLFPDLSGASKYCNLFSEVENY